MPGKKFFFSTLGVRVLFFVPDGFFSAFLEPLRGVLGKGREGRFDGGGGFFVRKDGVGIDRVAVEGAGGMVRVISNRESLFGM